MCDCCNGVGQKFEARGMNCKIVIRQNIMSVYLPNNATDLRVTFCPLCGRKLNVVERRLENNINNKDIKE